MRRLLTALAFLVVVGAAVLAARSATNAAASSPEYKIEFDNAFGLVTGAGFKVAGVPAGTIKSIDLDPRTLHAVVTVSVTQPGFGAFHKGTLCKSAPQSLIGEYFITCNPGSSGPLLKPGATIPVTHTQSTIAADLLQDIMRMPYRERLTLVVNELGAAVAGNSDNLQAALRRAVPALTETNNLLSLLAGDSQNLKGLTAHANTVITALADNGRQVQRFIVQANNAASDTATQSGNLRTTLQRLPGFLGQLRPALSKLGAATQANEPVLANLNSSAREIDRLFTDLPPFSRSSLPAIRSLGRASVTGKVAVRAAGPTVTALRRFARPTPELAQNLAIVTRQLDDRRHAVEKNAESPNGQGYTGLEALLQFAFNLAAATNTYGPFGHELTVDAFASPMCTPYATPGTVATNLKLFGAAYRQCYSSLGPNQPGVTTTDPSNPGGCVPDPGGAPPGQTAPTTSACKLGASSGATKPARATRTLRAPLGGSGANHSASDAGAAAQGSGASAATQKLLNYLLAP